MWSSFLNSLMDFSDDPTAGFLIVEAAVGLTIIIFACLRESVHRFPSGKPKGKPSLEYLEHLYSLPDPRKTEVDEFS